MCRETELEWSLGGADLDDTLASLRRPRTTGKVERVKSPEPPSVLDMIPEESPTKVVQPILRRSSSSASGPRLLPYFPKHGITTPPTPQSLSRNVAVSTQSSSSPPPPSKATARNPSPLPSQRASANSTLAPTKKSARNPSPTPVCRPTSRTQTSEKVSKPIPTTNSSTAVPSRATARTPSPTPTSRTQTSEKVSRPIPTINTSTAAPSRATARTPSPTPAPRTSATRKPSPTPASRASARNPSPTPAPRTSSSAGNPSLSSATGASTVQLSSVKNGVAPSSNAKTVTSTRRPASPTVTRRKPSSTLYDENGRVYYPDSIRKPASTMSSSPASSMDSSGELSPRSALDVNKALRMSINRSLKSEGLGAWSPESPTYSPVKKLTPLELQAQKKERIAGYGRKAGSLPKSARVACEGMLPNSPLKPEARKRCHWVTPESEPGLVSYHDEVWGVPVHDDKVLFELLVLEGAQAELTRPQILSITEYFRKVFRGFDPEIVAEFDEKKVAALKSDEIIRQPEAKLRAVIDNAKQVLKILREILQSWESLKVFSENFGVASKGRTDHRPRNIYPHPHLIVQEFGSFDKYLWNFVGFKPIVNTYRIFTQIPVKSSKAETLSKDLMRRGFRYVGPTTVYSFMQAAGMVNDHLVSCYRHGECCEVS